MFRVSLSAMILVLIFVPLSHAATIHGTVYSWDTLEPVKKAIVTINTTPEQKIVSNGTYSFTVPNGTYVIKAFFKQDDTELYAEENVTIIENGDYIVDLILFPKLGIEDVEQIEFPQVEEGEDNYYYLISIPILALIVLSLYYLKRKERLEKAERLDKIKDELPEDLIEVVDIIRKEGGRISQKELRKKLRYSEAKMSLIIADLERRNIVEKVKKGRGNIIFLKEKGD